MEPLQLAILEKQKEIERQKNIISAKNEGCAVDHTCSTPEERDVMDLEDKVAVLIAFERKIGLLKQEADDIKAGKFFKEHCAFAQVCLKKYKGTIMEATVVECLNGDEMVILDNIGYTDKMKFIEHLQCVAELFMAL